MNFDLDMGTLDSLCTDFGTFDFMAEVEAADKVAKATLRGAKVRPMEGT
jgi:hypothetical protein